MDYQAPVKDIRLALQVAGLDAMIADGLVPEVEDGLARYYPGLHLTEASIRATFDAGFDAAGEQHRAAAGERGGHVHAAAREDTGDVQVICKPARRGRPTAAVVIAHDGVDWAALG